MSEPSKDEKLKLYPKTENFEVVDTIGVPHPFMISSPHVVYASDHHSGMLTAEAIRGLEKSKGNRPSCGMLGCQLKYDEHEQALLVKCKSKDNDLLKEYLLSIKDLCESHGFAGFAFLDGTEKNGG